MTSSSMCRASSVVLVDEIVYFYRVGHHGQITAPQGSFSPRRSARFEYDHRRALGYSASAELWANFIWFQAWLILLLVPRIADAYPGNNWLKAFLGLLKNFLPRA